MAWLDRLIVTVGAQVQPAYVARDWTMVHFGPFCSRCVLQYQLVVHQTPTYLGQASLYGCTTGNSWQLLRWADVANHSSSLNGCGRLFP